MFLGGYQAGAQLEGCMGEFDRIAGPDTPISPSHIVSDRRMLHKKVV